MQGQMRKLPVQGHDLYGQSTVRPVQNGQL